MAAVCYGYAMATGIEGFIDDLGSPKLGTTAGPGAYDRLLQILRGMRDDAALLEPLAAAWVTRTFETVYARPLLLLAALRYRALEGGDHPLGFEVLMDAEAPDLEGRTREALADPLLVPILAARSVQTNEPGRAFAWGLPALSLAMPHRGFALADLGCSAGLNLVVDRTAIDFRFGVNKLAGFDFPSPGLRLGLDLAPIDVADPDDARWLEACIWPGQPERLARFRACRDVYLRRWQGDAPAPVIEAHALGEGLTSARLEALGDRVIAYESVVRPYLSEAARARHDSDMRAFLEGHRERLWAVLDPSENPQPSTPMTLTLHLVRGGELVAIPVAQSGYHASACVIVPGAMKRLLEAWAA
jgi:hypothetical protein